MDLLDFFLNWLVFPLIIIYGFVSWCKEHPNTKFWNSPNDKKKEEKQSDRSSIESKK